ncbi:MAG: porin [Candidatus Binatus sp.]|uniref:OprO/OprP family phosphate-selective porin n=1 Tax=Candidatus Binatus sp. TaxID=2811406 RepID=UPI0027190F71|nr:porin [Candidatus Binatus sp.]MDO8432145.1 porin [Candidatus Binatus sp.]
MNNSAKPFLPAVLVLALSGIFPTGSAQAQNRLTDEQKNQVISELKEEIKKLEARVETLESLDQKVKMIDRKLEVQQETEIAKAKELPVVKAGAQGFSLSSPNNEFQFKLGALLQGDGHFFTSGNDKPTTGSTFYLNRARPIFTATVFKYYEFNLTPDFGQGKVTLQDAYLNSSWYQQAQLLSGKFRSPFGLERLQSDRDLAFSQRAETENLVPNRDIGAEVHSDLFDGRLTYQLALMNGVPNNTASVDFDNNDGKDFLGRVFALPFKKSDNQWLRAIGVGFAGTYGDERGSTVSTYKTYGSSTWFSYNKGVTASGERYRLSPQAYYYNGPFSMMAQYVSDRHTLNRFVKLTKGLVNDTETFTDDGYSAQATYVLTGEDASYYGVKPYHVFDPRVGTIGAWELAARISNVSTDSSQFKLNFANPTVSARTATEWAVGMNWYLNNFIKWQFDYARTFFDKGAVFGDRPDESVFETQLQIAF